MGDSGAWARLAMLLGDDAAVVSAVEEALEADEDPWEALLDGLDEAGLLAYLQADDTGMELTDALAQLPLVFAAQPDLDDATDTDDLVGATAAAETALTPAGLRIVRLVEDDESWPLVVLPEGRLDQVIALAERLGHTIVRALQ